MLVPKQQAQRLVGPSETLRFCDLLTFTSFLGQGHKVIGPILTFLDLAIEGDNYNNKVIITMVIRPLDDRAYCA